MARLLDAIEHPVARALSGPTLLARRRLPIPPRPGVYVVASGDCISHIGISGSLRARVATLAALGTHRGSAEVLCAAYCTRAAPCVWWHETASRADALAHEAELKALVGEPPVPRDVYAECVNGSQLIRDIVDAAGPDTWEAGFAEATFAIGEKLALLFVPRFAHVWSRIGAPPGPWTERLGVS